MKNALLFIAAISFLYACNSSNKQSARHRTVLITHKEAADTMRLANIDTATYDSLFALIEYGYLQAQKSKEVLQNVNYGSLLLSVNDGYTKIYNGFYDTTNYRVEFYISAVASDTANPFVVAISGKCKYKENITDFTGVINIDSLFSYRDITYSYREFLTYADSTEKFTGDTTINTYHAKGTFILKEDSNLANTGAFTGNFFMDFVPEYTDNQLQGHSLWRNTENETRRGGFLFDGLWASYKSGQQKQVIFAEDLFMFANEILEDFSYGEREIEINEKYRSLGWENYWEGEEWWNSEGAPKLMTIFSY